MLMALHMWAGVPHLFQTRAISHDKALIMVFGRYRSGLRHGHGRLEKDDQLMYDGEWSAGKMEGRGRYTWTGAASGRGCYTVTYEGHLLAGQRHGHGKLIAEDDGSMYEGQWQCNKRHGYGVYTTGKVRYEGEWKEDERTGQGMLSRGSETVYAGQFWRGYWVSLNWHQLRYWLGFIVARIVYPAVGALIVLAIGYCMVLPAPVGG